MKLLTQAMLERFTELGSQDVKDPIVVARFFHPYSNWSWYATAYYPKDRVFFGLVVGFEAELGYFSLDEFEQIKIKGLGMERDLGFVSDLLSVIKKRYKI